MTQGDTSHTNLQMLSTVSDRRTRICERAVARIECLDPEQVWVGKVLLLFWTPLLFRLPCGYTAPALRARFYRALGLHGTLEIDKERDWTAKCPCPAWTWHEKRATENGSVPICSCIYSHSHFLVLCFDSFFFSFFFCFCSKCISALRCVVPTRVSNLARALGLLLFTCETSILGSLLRLSDLFLV